MKFLNTTFDDYIQSNNEESLHKSLQKIYTNMPEKFNDLKNFLFYGPSGVGKYTQALSSIVKYSPSNLKYNKKLCINYNTKDYFFKISDIHFEIDMSLLGCNSKLLWNELYNNIIDILSSRSNKTGIIMCKNFQSIHSELLESFYSYIQSNNISISIKYIILTEQISFIPDNIINSFYIISVPRPTKLTYNKILANANTNTNTNTNNTKLNNTIKLNTIYNIKDHIVNTVSINDNNNNYTEKLYNKMMSPKSIKFLEFRDFLYDIFIYDININNVIWILLNRLLNNNHINENDMNKIMIDTYSFLQYYNNNYRPIYHLEAFLFNLINIIHEL